MDVRSNVRAFLLVLLGYASGQGTAASLLAKYADLKLKPEMEIEVQQLRNSEWFRDLNKYASRNTANADECTSPLQLWTQAKSDEMGEENYRTLFDLNVFEMPYVYKHFIDGSESDEYFGSEDQYTTELIHRHESTKLFWKEADQSDRIENDGVLLLGMHGTDLEPYEKLIPTLQTMFGTESVYDMYELASDVQQLILALPGGYRNPLLTLNAMAVNEFQIPATGERFPDSILIGDGVLEFLEDLKLGSDGPDFVHAHEYGHHMQFELGVGKTGTSTEGEESRRLELMADAFSAYFLAHDLGGNMEAEQIKGLHETAFSTGDCGETHHDHHGTPAQRECAAIWGASKAAPDGDLLDPRMFLGMFEADLDLIIALDDGACRLVLEGTSYDGEASTSTLESNNPESNGQQGQSAGIGHTDSGAPENNISPEACFLPWVECNASRSTKPITLVHAFFVVAIGWLTISCC